MLKFESSYYEEMLYFCYFSFFFFFSLETGVNRGPCGSHEGESDDTDGSGGGKFRRLQMKWEMLSGRDTPVSSTHTSPTASPVRSKYIILYHFSLYL